MKNNSAIKWLWNITGKKKIYIVILLAVQAVLGASSIFYAFFLRNIIDCASEKDSKGFAAHLVGIIALVIGQILLRAVVRRVDELSRSTFENMLKGRLFGNLLKKDYASVTAVHSGEWINRLTNDTVVCANGLTDILPGLAGMTVKMCGALVMIILIVPKFMYVLIPGGILLILLTYAFRKVLKRLHKSIQEKDGKLRVLLQETLGSLLVVRSFAAESQIEDEAADRMNDHKKVRMKRNNFSNFCNIGFAGAMNGMYLLGVAYGGVGIMNGTLSYGTLMAILQLISQIQSPFANITGYLPKFYAMTASAERLMEAEAFEDYCAEGVIDKDEIHRFYTNCFKVIRFDNAGFTYLPPVRNEAAQKESMPVVMKNVSIEINKGEYVAFTGHSGCGKSTLLKLLMCLYPLDEGKRYIISEDGNIDLTSRWSRLFAYVPQGNQLMSGTVREIVAFADKSRASCDTEIGRALKISCADEFVSRLENGVDTMLGERGAGLSEGQMQRIAIARAVFSDAPILLFDEATSALDEQTEKNVLQNLKNMTDKTVLIVTHRPAALDICDKIVNFSETGIETKEKHD
ncbi:MAG: ABC transporter ATP-binding protein [Candidatus Ornithomonoglobus sp.]